MTSPTEEKPIGYTIGDDYDQVIKKCREGAGGRVTFTPVPALTPEQEALRSLIADTKRAKEEAEEAAAAALKSCKHPVFETRGGWLYDSRWCLVCGKMIEDGI